MILCSECGKSLSHKTGPDPKTCSPTCRSKRSRRQRRERKAMTAAPTAARTLTPHQRDVNDMVSRDAVRDEATVILREELRPVIREAITEDIFKAIREMVRLTPEAVESLADDIRGDNANLAHRAAALVVKYTVGHASLVRPDDAENNGQLVVNFNLPRPDDEPAGLSDVEGEATVLRTCDSCAQDKPEAAFVGTSTRCGVCFEQRRLDVMARFGEDG